MGAKVSKTCVLLHVPLESFDIQAALYEKGFSGVRPSLWVLQVICRLHFCTVSYCENPHFFSLFRLIVEVLASNVITSIVSKSSVDSKRC